MIHPTTPIYFPLPSVSIKVALIINHPNFVSFLPDYSTLSSSLLINYFTADTSCLPSGG